MAHVTVQRTQASQCCGYWREDRHTAQPLSATINVRGVDSVHIFLGDGYSPPLGRPQQSRGVTLARIQNRDLVYPDFCAVQDNVRARGRQKHDARSRHISMFDPAQCFAAALRIDAPQIK